jgi:hypothetical protein
VIARHHVPPPIDNDRGERLVAGQQSFDRLAEWSDRRGRKWQFGVLGCNARRGEQGVSFSQRHLERLGDAVDHLGTRARPARLDE